MLFLYNPVPSLFKNSTSIDSFFDDDFTSSIFVKRPMTMGEDVSTPRGALKISLDVPGVKESDIQVTLDQNLLKIQGETQNRRFQKILTVNTDETDLSQLSANLCDGVLTVMAPPKSKPAPVEIPVTYNNDAIEEGNGDERMCLSIEIPGVKQSDLKVTLEEGNTLHVRGLRRGKEFDKTYAMDVDKINTSELTANLSHGILLVQAPKLPKPKPQSLAIEASATSPNESSSTTEANVLVAMDMPGVRIQDVSVNTIQVDKRHSALDIQGSRNNNNKKLKISKMVLVDHDTYNLDEIKAHLADGVLTITAPKKPQAQPKHIPIMAKPSSCEGETTNKEDKAKECAGSA